MLPQKSIVVKAVDLGHKAPRVTVINGKKPAPPGYDFRLDADVIYLGEAFVKLEVVVGSGLLNLTVPITIDELWLKGKVRQNVDGCSFITLTLLLVLICRCDSTAPFGTEEARLRQSRQVLEPHHKLASE